MLMHSANRLHHVSEDQRRFRGGDEGGRDDSGHLGAHQGQTHLPISGDGPAQVRKNPRYGVCRAPSVAAMECFARCATDSETCLLMWR